MSEPTLRVELAACHRFVARLGWTDLVHTHISARHPEKPDHALLTPFGLGFSEVTASSLVTIGPDGSVVDDPRGTGTHPAAAGVHLPILAARPDVVCVLHTHTVAGIAVSAQRAGLRPISQHALRFWNRLARHPFGGVALEADEGERLAADLGPHHAMLLDNHGLLTTGTSVADAFERMHFLQRACEVQVAVGSADCHEVDPETAEHTARQFERPEREAVARTWATLIRTLDREEPEYRR